MLEQYRKYHKEKLQAVRLKLYKPEL